MDENIIKEYYEKNPEGIEPIPKIPEIYEMHEHIKNSLSNKKYNKLLDIGCGKGFTGKSIINFCKNYYGIDISSSAVKIAKKKIKNGNFVVGSALNLPYEDKTFDLIVCSEVLEHIPKFKKAIKEISRVVKTNGDVIVTCPNKFNPDMMLKTYLEGKYTKQIYDKPIEYYELIREFKNNNLRVDTFFSFWFFPTNGDSLGEIELKKQMSLLESLSNKYKKPLGLYLFFKLRKE